MWWCLCLAPLNDATEWSCSAVLQAENERVSTLVLTCGNSECYIHHYFCKAVLGGRYGGIEKFGDGGGVKNVLRYFQDMLGVRFEDGWGRILWRGKMKGEDERDWQAAEE